jgi:mannose-6-phosphate isomerase-like protein (cupin superfamily)
VYESINLDEKFGLFSDCWRPKIIAGLNDYHLKLVKIHGDFVWHDHPETDELFLVIKGKMEIDFRDGKVAVNEGELIVVPKGTEHKPYAAEPCQVLVIEPAGTVNTGAAGGERTAPADAWI